MCSAVRNILQQNQKPLTDTDPVAGYSCPDLRVWYQVAYKVCEAAVLLGRAALPFWLSFGRERLRKPDHPDQDDQECQRRATKAPALQS